MKTNEQLEKQISEEFEKYWSSTFEGMSDGDFIKYRNLGKSNAKEAFKAAALPLFKRVKELEETEVILRKSRDNYHYINEQLKKELELRTTWVKHHQASVENALKEKHSVKSENEQLKEDLKWVMEFLKEDWKISWQAQSIRQKWKLDEEGK